MGALVKDLERDDDKVQLLPDASRGAAISRLLHANILPIFLVMATLCYIDRTNSAFASLQMTHDLKFDAETYGLGSGLFFVGYSLFMIPSQFILMKVGAPRWLACIVAAWGLTAMSFAFMKNKVQFFVLRLLLGVAESGAFPAMWYYLNSFYPPDQITVPYALIEAAVGFANVAGAPLAASLLMLDGVKAMHGWQWLFLLEGLPSVATGIAMAYVLPRDLQSSRFLAPGDKAWLAQALSAHKKHAQEAESHGHVRLLLDAARNGRVWLTGLAALLKNAAMVGILFWAPIIVNTLLKGGAVDLGTTRGTAVPAAHGHRHLLHSSSGGVGSEGGAGVLAPLLQHQLRVPLATAAAAGNATGNSTAGISGQAVAAVAAVSQQAATALAAAAAANRPAASSAASGGGSSSSDRGVAAVLLTAVPFISAAACAVWLGHRSQRRKEKCWHVAVPYGIAATLFVLFPSVASLGGGWAFLCLTAAITSLTAPNAILNSMATAVSTGPSSAIGLALYNAVGNLGGLVGPWLIGRVLRVTGLYATALQALGVMVAAAGLIAAYMKRWNV